MLGIDGTWTDQAIHVTHSSEISKARQLLGVPRDNLLSYVLDEEIPWIERAIAEDRI